MRKELEPKDWMERIWHGLEFRAKFGMEETWADCEDLFYNKHSTSLLGPNIIMSTGDALMSALAIEQPSILIRPAMGTDPNAASILESVDNELIEDIEIPQEMDNGSLSAFLWGVGFLKNGYDSEYGWDPNSGSIRRFGADLDNEGTLGMSLSQFGLRGQRLEFDSRVRSGWPWIKSVLPHDIVVPWGVRTLKDAPWIAHRVVRHIDAVKSDVKYTNTKNLKPSMSIQDFVESYEKMQISTPRSRNFRPNMFAQGTGSAVEYVELWEIHDRLTGKVYVIETNYDKYLRNQIDLTQLAGLPFTEISFVPKARSLWVTPDAYYLMFPQAELADIAVMAAKQRRICLLRFLVTAGSISETELNKLFSGEVGAVATLDEGADPRNAVVPMTPMNNNQSLYSDTEFIRRDAREMVGFSRNQMGEYESKGRRTATEVAEVASSANSRMGRRGIIMARAYKEVIRKANSFIFNFWKTPRWTEILGQDATPQYVQYIGEKLKGDYRYSVVFGQEPGTNLAARRAQSLQLYAALRQDPNVDQDKLTNYVDNAGAASEPALKGVIRNAGLPVQMPTVQQPGGGASPGQSDGQRPPALPARR